MDINGAIANTRDLGPALGGLIGGPVVGIGAGLIGGLQRLAMGGYTAVPSALGAVAAGVAGGVVFLLYKRRVAPVWAAMLLAVFTESVLMGLNLLMARPFHDALELVEDVIVPMILVNAAGMGLFVFIVHNEERERLTAAQKERMEGELTVARDIQRSIVPMHLPAVPGARGVRPARLARAGAGGRRRPLRLLPARRRPPLPRHRRRGRQGRAGLAVHGRDDHAAARRRARHERAPGTTRPTPPRCWPASTSRCAADNEAAMFVTLFYGVYRVSTGELTYSVRRAPAAVPAPRGRQRRDPAAAPRGPASGSPPRPTFGTATLQLEPGDGLLCYTDGVTEAMDAQQRMFGTERLRGGPAGRGTAAGARSS